MKWRFYVFGILFLIIVFILYCCIRVAGEADQEIEKYKLRKDDEDDPEDYWNGILLGMEDY